MVSVIFLLIITIAWYKCWQWFKNFFNKRVRTRLDQAFRGRPNYDIMLTPMGKIKKMAKEKLEFGFKRWRSWRRREKRAWEKVHDRILSRWEMATSLWGLFRQFMPQTKGFQRPQKKNLFWTPWQGDPPNRRRKHKPNHLLPILSSILERRTNLAWTRPGRFGRLAARARKAKKDRLALLKYYAEQRKKKAIAKKSYAPRKREIDTFGKKTNIIAK